MPLVGILTFPPGHGNDIQELLWFYGFCPAFNDDNYVLLSLSLPQSQGSKVPPNRSFLPQFHNHAFPHPPLSANHCMHHHQT